MTRYPMEFEPFDVAKACRETIGGVAAEPFRPNLGDWSEKMLEEWCKAQNNEKLAQHRLLDDIFGNPFRPVVFEPSWRTSTAVAVAYGIYEERAFDRMPILADALEDAGCDNEDILNHCRQPGEHVRGCWVVDFVLGNK